VTSRARLRELWWRGQQGWPPSFPVAQFPNPPLLLALGGWSAAAFTHDTVQDYARATFYVGLSAWGWDEARSGANWVRRASGAAGLVYVVIRVGEALGG
jgi:hypothetical protein